MWGVLLAPYIVFATVSVVTVVTYRLGWYDMRASVIEVGSGLAAGTVIALLLWPAAYLLEHVLRRLRRRHDGFRNLALWILAGALYMNASVDVLAAVGLIPREQGLVLAVRRVSSVLVFAAVPLFLVWVVLVLFPRER